MTNILLSVILLLSHPAQVVEPIPVYASTPSIVAVVASSTTETIKWLIKEESIALGVNPATSTDIAFYESSFNPNATNGTDDGLYAFNNKTFQEKCIDKYKFAQNLEQKWDYKIQIKCAVKLMADGQYWRWASSRDKWNTDYAGNNCVWAARLKDPTIPLQDALKFIPNTTIPRVGDLLVMKYGEKGHITIIGSITKVGYKTNGEGNYIKGMIIDRVVKFDDSHIVGFWTNKKD